MLKFNTGYVALILLNCLAGCSGTKESLKADKPEPGIAVTVEDATGLDGCTFLLIMDDGSRLQPVNLPEQYCKNGVRIMITYREIKGVSVCMAGKMVEVTSVREFTRPEKPR